MAEQPEMFCMLLQHLEGKNMRILVAEAEYCTFIWLNPFVPNAPFLYPLQTSENRKVFRCFQGVEKGALGTNGFNDGLGDEYKKRDTHVDVGNKIYRGISQKINKFLSPDESQSQS